MGTRLTFQAALTALGTVAPVSVPALGVSSQAGEGVAEVTGE